MRLTCAVLVELVDHYEIEKGTERKMKRGDFWLSLYFGRVNMIVVSWEFSMMDLRRR